MKKLMLVLTAIIGCHAFATDTLTDGLVAYYPLDGHGKDLSDNEYHGMLNGLYDGVEGHDGKPNGSLDFYGGESVQVDMPYGSSFTPTELSYAFWLKDTGEQFEWRNSIAVVSVGSDFVCRFDNCVSGKLTLSLSGNGKADVPLGISFPFNEWHHWAVTIGDGTMTVYLDGKLLASKSGCSLGGEFRFIEIGSAYWAGHSSEWTEGNIDDLCIYRRVLSADEVTALAGGEIPKGKNRAVTFYANGGTTENETMVVPKGSTLGDFGDAERKGFDFVCWCTDSTMKRVLTFDIPIEDNMNAYALWHRKSTTVLHEGCWWYYDFYGNDGTAIEVLGIVDGEIPSELKIPETLDGMKVASIGDYAFAWCDEIKTLELNTNLSHLGWASFTCCRNLEAVKIPGTLSRLGDFAFSSCDSLWDVEIGHGVKELGQGCFQYLPQLTFVTIPSSVTNVEWYAMSQDTYLFEVTFRGKPPTINGKDGTTIQYSAEGMFEGSEFVSVHVLNDNGWKDANGERITQWSFREVYYEPSLPPYSEGLTDRDVCDILAGTSFELHITNGEEYSRFREWVDYAIGEYAIDEMHQILKANPYSWLSYALYLDKPLTAFPTENQFKIVSFCKSADAGNFEIELAIDGVTIDERAIRLSEVLAVEGSDRANGTYSTDKVNAVYAVPNDGKVKVTVSPADPLADSFFLRAVIRP